MKRIACLLISLFLSGCAASQSFTVSPESFKSQVKTLGVLPVLVDIESIDYSSAEELVGLLQHTSAAVQEKLVERLRKQGRYFDVREVTGDPRELLTRVVDGQAPVGEGAAARLEYSFNPQGSAELADEAVADAVLVVVVYGIHREEKRWSSYSLSMEYLTAQYNSLLYTAAIVDPTGRVLWQLDMPAGEVLLRLDYPDFTEAYWNRNESVRIKSISLAGLRRTLQEPDTALLVDKEMAKPYSQMIDRIVQQMK